MRRDVAAAVPAAARHQAPVADALGGVVGVVEVGEAEQQVAELVRAHTDLGVLGNGEVAEDLRRRRCCTPRPASTCATRCRPRLPVCSAPLPGVHDDEGVDEAVAVVVVGAEVDAASEAAAASRASSGRPEGGAVLADAGAVVGVVGERLRHPVGTDDVAVEVDQTVGDLGVVLRTLPCGSTPVEKKRSWKCCFVRGHLLVGEVDEHDGHPDGAAQRSSIQRCRRGWRPWGCRAGKDSGGMITPSLKPRWVGSGSRPNTGAATPLLRLSVRDRSLSHFSLSSGLGPMAHVCVRWSGVQSERS